MANFLLKRKDARHAEENGQHVQQDCRDKCIIALKEKSHDRGRSTEDENAHSANELPKDERGWFFNMKAAVEEVRLKD